jgi:flagellar hook-associated protein 2
MAIESIAKTIGSGSGIDITTMVDQLVEASFANKNAALTAKDEKLTSQISKAGELKSSISEFAAALAQLTAGGGLSTQPTSANSGVVTATRLSGATLASTSASVEVRQIAQGQVASSAAIAGGAASVIGTGTLTLTFGTASVSDGAMASFTPGPAAPIAIAIDAQHNTLQGVAEAINAAKAGVTASVVTDASGARLVVKSATGASQAFELKGSGDLATLDIGAGETGSTINTAAQNAVVALDGVAVTYPTNSISNLIEGVRLELVSAAPGTRVTIGATRPTAAISQTVTNFVETYNQVYAQLKDAVDPINGPLRGDSAAKALFRQLKQITLTELVPGADTATPRMLADIGVATQRDGTLRVDSARLTKVLTEYPDAIEAMFAEGAGLTKAMNAIAAAATDRELGLSASEATYTKQQGKIAEDKGDVLVATENMRTRMTQQFAAMDARVAAYKSTQSFLEQQIDSWNASR